MRVPRVVAAWLLIGGAWVVASEPLLPPEILTTQADVVVVGQVKDVYSRIEDDGDGSVTAQIVFAVAVAAVEKGDSVRAGDLLYVRSSKNIRMPPDYAGQGGQGSPAVGVRVRAYLRRDGGGYYPVSPNGLVWLDGQTASYEVAPAGGGWADAGRFWWLAVAGSVVGLVCGLALGRRLRSSNRAAPGAAADPAAS